MKSRPLFFLFDSVHTLKCIRNNWIGQKGASKCMLLPKFYHNGNQKLDSIQSDPFYTLQKLHALGSQLILRCYHKLTTKTLSPTNLERQNANFIQQIFNEYTVQGLLALGKQKYFPNFAKIAENINIFYIWWAILNVKRLFKGCQHRNKYSRYTECE